MKNGSKRVLVVEDEAVTALDLKGMLVELGYECVAIVNRGEDAISEAKINNPNLVIMDIRLKGDLDGLDAAKIIWDTSGIPIVFLTSYSDEQTLARAKLVQPYGYILKPFDLDELRKTLELAFFRFSDSSTQSKSQESLPPPSDYKETPISELLLRIAPFSELPREARHSLSEEASIVKLHPGDVFIGEDQGQQECFVVLEGRIACLKSSRDGKELILHLLPPGDVFGVIIGLYDESSHYTVRAERESLILKIPASVVKKVLEQNHNLYQELNDLLLTRLKQSDELSQQLAHERVEVRVATALLMLIGEFAKHNRNDHTEVIDITRQELSQLAGTTPETTIRITKKMEAKGMLDLSRPGSIVVLDKNMLKTVAHEEDFT